MKKIAILLITALICSCNNNYEYIDDKYTIDKEVTMNIVEYEIIKNNNVFIDEITVESGCDYSILKFIGFKNNGTNDSYISIYNNDKLSHCLIIKERYKNDYKIIVYEKIDKAIIHID